MDLESIKLKYSKELATLEEKQRTLKLSISQLKQDLGIEDLSSEDLVTRLQAAEKEIKVKEEKLEALIAAYESGKGQLSPKPVESETYESISNSNLDEDDFNS